MAARKWSGDNKEGWRNLVEKSVLESANECSDFSEDETEAEVNSIVSDNESNEDSEWVTKRMRTLQALLNTQQ
jgi:hypothetical protein